MVLIIIRIEAVRYDKSEAMIAARAVILLTLLASAVCAGPAWSREVAIGVLAFRGVDNCLKRWGPTARYLSTAVADHRFRIVPLSLEEMSSAAARGDVDFILTNTGNYVELEARYGISRVATLRAPGDVTAGNIFGAVIFTRANRRDLRTLQDLKGKRFMAVKPHGFGGFQMAWRELKDNGIDPFADFSSLTFSGFPQDKVAAAVRDGVVIFTRANRRDLRTLQDLKGKRFMAVKPHGFGGFQMAWRELKDNGIDPFADFSSLTFSGFPQDKVAAAVRDGVVDAGTFRTGSLESLAAEGKIDISDFQVLHRKVYTGFPFAVSTRLYPEWPFSKLRTTPQDVSQKVAVALLSMPANSPAAQAGGYGGWTVPLDYQPVHELFRELRIGPYEDLGDITMSDVFKQYGPWMILVVLILILTVSWAAWIEFLVTRRTRELSLANKELERQVVERQRVEEVARQRQAELAHVARLNTMGEMASGLAHELNHPLATITNYAKGCIRRLRSGDGDPAELLEALEHVSGQADRAADLIRSIRDFVRKEGGQRESANINEIVRDVAGLIEFEIDNGGISLEFDLTDPLPPVTADVVQIEQAILNLARNAIEAMRDVEPGRRRLRIATTVRKGDSVELSVKDTGPGIPDALVDTMFNPFVSATPGGLGLGLSISRSIIETHGGRVWIAASDEGGSDLRFTLPVAP